MGYAIKNHRYEMGGRRCGEWESAKLIGILRFIKIAHAVGVKLYEFSLELPRFEQYEAGSQLRRASKSISANIVEGFGRRRYKAEFIRFLVFAHSSCNETIEWMEYIRDCYPDLEDNNVMEILQKLDELGRKLNSFIRAVEKDHKS